MSFTLFLSHRCLLSSCATRLLNASHTPHLAPLTSGTNWQFQRTTMAGNDSHETSTHQSILWIVLLFVVLILVVASLSVTLRCLYIHKRRKRYAPVPRPADLEAAETQSRQAARPVFPDVEGYYAPSAPPPAAVAPRVAGDDTMVRDLQDYQGFYTPSPEVAYSPPAAREQNRKSFFA